MGRIFGIMAGALTVAAAAQSAPLKAQYMPHLDPNLYMLAMMNYGMGANPCMTGTPMSDAKVAEARTLSLATMQRYFRAAQGGSAKSAAFLLDKKSKWQGGGVTAGQSTIDIQADPLAAPDHLLEAEPLRFYRGGAGATALGQWAVLDSEGAIVGVYTAFFTRSKKEWKLRELTLTQREEIVAPIAQYCRKPGDVMEHRLSSSKTWRENAQKNVDEARSKLAAASERATNAEGAAAANPRDRRLAETARDARRERDKWIKQLDKRERALADALEEFVKAEKDEAEIVRLTGAARGAGAFRVTPEAETVESD